jgi:peptidyl-prolyl cis-trans isomerase A (cyclophilin A)
MRILPALLLAIAVLPAPTLAADPRVELKTNQGTIVLELNPAAAPKTVENFLGYVKRGHYNGTIFHRVIDGFMIQGGGMDANMKEKSMQAPIQNEAKNGLKNTVGTVAMARTMDPHSATAQFFINVNDNAFLDYPGRDGWGYAVFGKVVDGLPVVQAIAKSATGNANGHQNVPIKPIVIESAKLIEDKPTPAKDQK